MDFYNVGVLIESVTIGFEILTAPLPDGRGSVSPVLTERGYWG